jgi:hypothetical protein
MRLTKGLVTSSSVHQKMRLTKGLETSSSVYQKMKLTKGLETSSSITVPFTAGKPRNLQHYMDCDESPKSG